MNPSNDGLVDSIQKWIRYDWYLRNKKVESDLSKYKFKARSLKKINKQSGVEFVEKSIRCLRRVPAKKHKQNILKNHHTLMIDNKTGEALMMDEEDKILARLYDPMQLVNFSRNDLWILDERAKECSDFWKFELDRYKKIIRTCLRENIHADSRRMLFEGNQGNQEN